MARVFSPMFQSISAVLILFLMFLTASVPLRSESRYERMDEYLNLANELWRFNGAVLVADRGGILLCRGYGFSNKDFGQPNTPQTRFFIGSITKQFTAAAVLALRDDSVLNLDSPIIDYLPDYPPVPGRLITIRHLLTHTSGIPNYTDDPEIVLMRTEPLAPDDIIDLFRNRPLEFAPGTSFQYSNSGYILLGKIIEVASGQSYEAFLHRRILKPAGMLSTGYGRRESGIPDRADGYTIDQIGNIISALPIDFSIMFSAGALYSTVLDIYRWDSLLYTDAILNRATIAEIFAPSQHNYGYGWYIDSLFERRLAFHGGFLDGYNAVLYRWLDDSVTVIVFSNEDEAPVAKIARGLSAIVFDEPYERPLRRKATRTDSKKLREYAGVYKYEDETYQFISLHEDTLYTNFRGMPRQVLLPFSRDNFFYASDNNKLLSFGRNDKGIIDHLHITDDIYFLTALRIFGPDTAALMLDRTPFLLDATSLGKFAGLYKFDSLAGNFEDSLFLRVESREEHLGISIGNGEAVAVYPNSSIRFFHYSADFQITFQLDEQGAPVGFLLEIAGKILHGTKINK